MPPPNVLLAWEHLLRLLFQRRVPSLGRLPVGLMRGRLQSSTLKLKLGAGRNYFCFFCSNHQRFCGLRKLLPAAGGSLTAPATTLSNANTHPSGLQSRAVSIHPRRQQHHRTPSRTVPASAAACNAVTPAGPVRLELPSQLSALKLE